MEKKVARSLLVLTFLGRQQWREVTICQIGIVEKEEESKRERERNNDINNELFSSFDRVQGVVVRDGRDRTSLRSERVWPDSDSDVHLS